ncbi:MAG: radical SAM-associated putative lipoprotein [Candidatus Cryptobacteroides sp.]
MIRVLSPILFIAAISSSCSAFFAKDDSSIPYSEYEILGKVVDATTGDPVTGVAVTLLEAMSGVGGNVEVGSKIDSIEVSQDGTFDLSGRSYRGVNELKFIRVTDLDQTMEGDYGSTVFQVSLTFDAEPPANAHQSEGSFANRDVLLTLEEQ